MNCGESDVATRYDDRLPLLYALAIGLGRDPRNQKELPFVSEQNWNPDTIKTLPTMATVLPTAKLRLIEAGINYDMVLHGEQRVQIHRPLPAQADLVSSAQITDVLDKGEGKGAIIYSETEVRLAKTDELLVTTGATIFARGDGGFSKGTVPSRSGKTPSLTRVPTREPDHIERVMTRQDQALLYRLCGDRNPLHADPELARRVGFDRPILHGLCSFGIACQSIVTTQCDYDPSTIRRFEARFTAPVLPGETLATDIWRDGQNIHFRVRSEDQNTVIINHGLCTLS